MGIIAWIVLGLVAGLLANMLIPGRRSQGLILTCVIGIVGALAQAQVPEGQAIVAAANQLTAGICQATGQRPTRVCTSAGVRAAATAMGLA